MAHDNAEIIRAGYAAFDRGDIEAVLDVLDPDIVWHAAGRNPMSGTYRGHEGVADYFTRLGALSGGTVRTTVHDVLANDAWAIALLEWSGHRGTDHVTQRVVHVWRMEGGRAVEFRAFEEDQYAGDAFLLAGQTGEG